MIFKKQNKNKNFSRKVIVFFTVAIFFLCLFSYSYTHADINKQINYQGKLTNDTNSAVPDGSYDMVFKLYDADTSGTLLWTGTHTTANSNPVTVTNGIFSVLLGSGTGNTLSLDFNSNSYYLQVEIYNSDTPAWETLSPRKQLGSVPSSFNSDRLDGLDSATSGANAHIIKTDSSGNLTVSGNTYFNGTTYYVNSSGTANLNGLTLAGNLVLGANTITTTNTTVVSNLNADLLDGHEGSYYLASGNISGTSGYIPKFTGTNTLGNSLITDNGTNIGIGGALGILEGGLTPEYQTIFQGGDQSANLTYTLPTAYPGTSGYVLSSTDAGVMSWIAAGGLPTGTEGQMMYNNAGTWTAFSGMNWDDTNSRLGIGTTTPGAMLTLYGVNNKLRLAYDDVYYTDLSTDASGNLNISSVGDVSIGSSTGSDVFIGDIGAGANLVFEESSTISGQGTNAITLGVSGDVINFNASGVTYNYGTISAGTWGGNMIGIEYGGTGISSVPGNNQILVGNGAGYGLETITEGTALDIVRVAGTSQTFSFDSTELGTTTWYNGTAGADIVWTFDGETNDGTFGYYEDEDSFSFTNSILGIGTTTPNSIASRLGIVGANTTGNTVSIANSTAAQTTSALLDISSSGYTTGYTGNVVNITGTSTTGASNLLNLSSANTTAGNAMNISANAITTGKGLNISSTGTGLTTGSLLYLTSATTGTVATNGIFSLNATGNYSSTSNIGLLNVSANATTAGTIENISGNALTNGIALNVASSSVGLTGDLASIIASGNNAGVTGNALKVGLTGASATGTALNITTAGASGFALRVNDDGTYTDSTPFVVDYAGNVGIGTASPSALFSVGSSSQFQIDASGNATSTTLNTGQGAYELYAMNQNVLTTSSPTFAGLTLTGLTGNIISTSNVGTSIQELDARLYNMQNTTKEITGFPNRTDTALSFDDVSRNFTITGTNFDVYSVGKKYTKNTASIQIDSAAGLYFIYYDKTSLALSYSTTPWSLADGTVQIATVYWSGTTGLIGEERHGLTMDGMTHEYLHTTVGTRYGSGLAGIFDNTSFSVAAGSIYDEDIKNSTSAATTTARVLYRSGANFAITSAQAKYFHEVSDIIQYDNAGTLTDVTNTNYVAYWIFATNDPSSPIYSLMGQRQDTNITNARNNNKYESLSLGTLPFKEMKLLYRVILRRNGTSETYTETEDLRNISNLPAGTYVATSHNTLTGLNSDDHTQYALLAGRSGGQTLIGGTDTTDDLILQTTSGVGTTGADMHFKVGNNGATEAMTILNNGNVGIGTASPANLLEIEKAYSATTWEGLTHFSASMSGASESYNGFATLELDALNSVTGVGSADAYAFYATARTANDSGDSQTAYGVGSAVETHPGDTGYAFRAENQFQGNSTGGTAYGLYISMNDTDVTNYGIYQSSANDNYFAGNISSDKFITANNATGGIVTRVSGAPTGSDSSPDGTIIIDSTNHRIYFRYSNTWHYVAQTAGFQIPNYEVAPPDQISKDLRESDLFKESNFPNYLTEKITPGELLIPYVDEYMQDGAAHGLYARFADVKDMMFKETDTEILTLQSETEILNTKADQNSTTIGELNNSIKTQLESFDENIDDLGDKIKNQETLTTGIDIRVLSLEDQMKTLKEQNGAVVDFITALNTQSLIYKDISGNLNLGEGKLEAGEIIAGTFTVKVIDEKAKTIGEIEILPIAKDEDDDGKDDYTKKSMDDPEVKARDGKSVEVETKAIGENSKVFLTPIGKNPVNWIIDEITPGAGFKIFLSEETTKTIKFNWWIVEEK